MINWRWFWRHRPQGHHHTAAVAVFLSFDKVVIHQIEGKLMATVSGTFTAPVKRKSGADLALTDIDHFSLTRNGSEIQKLTPSAPVISWSDATPLTGNDTYDVFTITKDGFISDSSNDAAVIIAAADPAVAITDLAATVGP